jgi:hypothetical protein
VNTLTKSTPLGTLGLTSGEHWVRFCVEEDSISFEIAASLPKKLEREVSTSKQPTHFVQKWGGSLKKIEDSKDSWLTHINDKHLLAEVPYGL